MKEEIQIGDLISWNEHPEIRTRIEKIEPSLWADEMMYICANGCQFTIDEIKKVKS